MSRALILLAALAVVGNGPAGPFLVQSVAWATMVSKFYARTGDVRKAWSDTFDGEHPCCLCRKAQAMAEEQQREQTPARTPVMAKELVLLLRPEERNAGFVVRNRSWIATLDQKDAGSHGCLPEDVAVPPPEMGRC